MIWHVHAGDFIAYLERIGFRRVAQTRTHDLYERGSDQILVRRADVLTQAEVDAICDAADLKPPKFDAFFGD